MNLLKLYYSIGKTINDSANWINKFIDELAIEHKITFSNIKGFFVRNLKTMKKNLLYGIKGIVKCDIQSDKKTKY